MFCTQSKTGYHRLTNWMLTRGWVLEISFQRGAYRLFACLMELAASNPTLLLRRDLSIIELPLNELVDLMSNALCSI